MSCTEVVLHPEALSEMRSPDCRGPAALCLQPGPGATAALQTSSCRQRFSSVGRARPCRVRNKL